MTKLTSLAIATGFIFCLTCTGTRALQISPINPQLSVKEHATMLWLEQPVGMGNPMAMMPAKQTTYQVRVYQWSQQGYQDTYADQQTILASPPVFQFADSGRQGIRLSREKRAAVMGEHAYRIIIDQIPGDHDDNGSGKSQGIKLQLRYVLSFFDYGSDIDPAYVPDFTGDVKKLSTAHWQIISNKGNNYCGSKNEKPYAYCLEITNKGPVHIRLSNIVFATQSVSKPYYKSTVGLMGYVLPGQTMRFGLINWHPLSTNGLKLFTQVKSDDYRIIGNE